MAAAEWAVPHPPGYPLYTFLIHCFSKLPVGELAYRANLASALFHSMTIGLVAAVVLELWESVPAALAACLSLAFSRSFFLSSLFAEAFPLNDLFCALVLLLALRVARARPLDPGNHRRLIYLGLAIGVASTHHQFIAFGAGGILWLAGPAVWRIGRTRPLVVAQLVAAFALPLLVGCALLLIAASRRPFLSWGDVHDLSSLARILTRADYGGLMHPSRHPVVTSVLGRLDAYRWLVATDFSTVLAGMSTVGLALTIARVPRQGLGLLLWWLGTGPGFALLFAYYDRKDELHLAVAQRFVTQSEVVLAVALAGAFAWVESSLAQFGRIRHMAHAVAAVPLAILGPDTLLLGMHDDDRGPAFVRDFMKGLPDDALVLLSGDVYSQVVGYACVVQRTCGNRVFLAPGAMFMPWYAQRQLLLHPEFFRGLPTPLGQRSANGIVANALMFRSVFVVPPLIGKDAALLESFASLPHGLVFQLYADHEAAEHDVVDFQARSQAMARGRELEGLSTHASAIPYPSPEVQVPLAYGAALANHAARIERQDALIELAAAIRERAEAMNALGTWPR